jgi:hypothetical protein
VQNTGQTTGSSPADLEKEIVQVLKIKGIVKQPNVLVEVALTTTMGVTVIGQVITPRNAPLFALAPLRMYLHR